MDTIEFEKSDGARVYFPSIVSPLAIIGFNTRKCESETYCALARRYLEKTPPDEVSPKSKSSRRSRLFLGGGFGGSWAFVDGGSLGLS